VLSCGGERCEGVEVESEDSDFEYDGSRVKKAAKGKKAHKGKAPERKAAAGGGRRRTHADSIPDSEKPFACSMCLARYKTRPGLTYHMAHSHKEKDAEGYQLPEGEGGEQEGVEEVPSEGEKPRKLPQGRSGPGQPRAFGGAGPGTPPAPTGRPGGPCGRPGVPGGPGGRPVGVPHPKSTYCDFCLGDATINKKQAGGGPEELIGCAECGRSGHPSCLQFSKNMLSSVRHYPWQCMECKTCSLCGTSENDDQLLFCDDCDRGYHMYCLVPPMKTAPEGSWSCTICTDLFHKTF